MCFQRASGALTGSERTWPDMGQVAGEAGGGQQGRDNKAPPGRLQLLLALPLLGSHCISRVAEGSSPVPQRCLEAAVLEQLRQLGHHLCQKRGPGLLACPPSSSQTLMEASLP